MQQFFFRPATGQPDQLYRSSSSRPSSDVPSGQKLPRLASKGDWGDSFAKRSWFIVHYGGRLQVEDAFTCCNSRYLYCAVQSRICNYRSHNITKVCVVSLKPLTPEKWDMLECSYGGNGNCSCRTTSWTTIRISHGKWGRSRHSLCTMYTMGIGLPDILGFRDAIMHRLFSCELCLRRLHRLMILETAISLATKRLGWQLTIAKKWHFLINILLMWHFDAFWYIYIIIYIYIYIYTYVHINIIILHTC